MKYVEKSFIIVLITFAQNAHLEYFLKIFLFGKISRNGHVSHSSHILGVNCVVYSLNLYIFVQAYMSLILTVTAMTIMLIFNTIPFSLALKPSKRPKTTHRPNILQIQPGITTYSALIYNKEMVYK